MCSIGRLQGVRIRLLVFIECHLAKIREEPLRSVFTLIEKALLWD